MTRRSNARSGSSAEKWRVPADSASSGPVRVGSRLAVFLLFIAGIYWVFWRSSYALFAPHLEAIRTVTPSGVVGEGEPLTLGVVVRNTGWIGGAAFVVAASGGVEVEGPTVDVPRRDTATVPVDVTMGPGDNIVSLVLFDGWRGVRRMRAFRGLHVHGGVRALPSETIGLPGQVTRGDTARVSFEWSNRRSAPQTVVPTIVFRSGPGRRAVPLEGPPLELAAGDSATLAFHVDTWPLAPGTYTADLSVTSTARDRIGFGRHSGSLEVLDR